MPRPSAPSTPEFNPRRYRARNAEQVRLERVCLEALTEEWQAVREIAAKIKLRGQAVSIMLIDLHKYGLVEWQPYPVTRYRKKKQWQEKEQSSGTKTIR